MKLDVLAIGAHPDDVEITCSGTIIKLRKQGRKVGVLDLTRGELGTRGTVEERDAEAAESARIMGIVLRENLDLPDGNIAVSPENRLKVIQVIRAHRPDVLLFPHWLERHPDHEHAHRLCRESWFYAGLEKIVTTREGNKQEPFRPRCYYHFMQTYEFIPSFIVDVSDEYEERLRAMRAFKSQFHDPNNPGRETFLSSPEFIELVRTRLEYFGDRIGRKYGEPFFSVNAVGVTDMFSLTT